MESKTGQQYSVSVWYIDVTVHIRKERSGGIQAGGSCSQRCHTAEGATGCPLCLTAMTCTMPSSHRQAFSVDMGSASNVQKVAMVRGPNKPPATPCSEQLAHRLTRLTLHMKVCYTIYMSALCKWENRYASSSEERRWFSTWAGRRGKYRKR